MKHGFYFKFYKIFHNEFLCCILARLAYMLYCCKFLLQKLTRKREHISMTYDEAHRIIDEVYPRPKSKPEYINPPISDRLDLSIVVPVYNYAEIIEQNILSLLNQKTKYKYEIILVDDGSTDGAADILRKYADNPKIRLIFQENAGIGAARNTGVNAASGKYLMFVDCDDTVHDDMVETLLDEAYNKDCDIVMASHNLVKERNGEVYDVMPNVYPKCNLSGYKNGDEIMSYAGLPWAKVYKRGLWNNVRFFPGYWYEDTIILMLVFTQCRKFSYIPKVVYEYKWYEKNFSHTQGNSKTLKSIDRYWIMREIIDKYFENGLKADECFYTLLLRHFSSFYYNDIKSLDESLVQALFVLAKEMVLEYNPKSRVKLPYMLRQVEKAFANNDICLWRITSDYQ